MIKWFKTLRRIVRQYDGDIENLYDNMTESEMTIRHAVNLIKERTTISGDIAINTKYENTIVVTGRYNETDYVRVFSIHAKDMSHLIRLLHDMEKDYLGKVRFIDAPISLDVVIKSELNRY